MSASTPRTYTVDELWSAIEAVPPGASRRQAMEQLAAALDLPLAPEPPKLPARVHVGPPNYADGLYDESGGALTTCDPGVPGYSSLDLATRRAFMIEAGRRYNAHGEVETLLREHLRAIADREPGLVPCPACQRTLETILRILRVASVELPEYRRRPAVTPALAAAAPRLLAALRALVSFVDDLHHGENNHHIGRGMYAEFDGALDALALAGEEAADGHL